MHWFRDAHYRTELGHYHHHVRRYPATTGQVTLVHRKKETSSLFLIKKPKHQALSAESKQHNKTLSSKRIYIEHSIGGMKRYRVLSNKLRTHDIDLYNDFLGVCAGLWNFYLLN